MSRRCVVWDLFNFVVGRGGTEDEELTHSLATAPITAFVDRDPRQPSAQRSGTIIFPQMAESRDRKSTRLNSITNAHLVCRLLHVTKQNKLKYESYTINSEQNRKTETRKL